MLLQYCRFSIYICDTLPAYRTCVVIVVGGVYRFTYSFGVFVNHSMNRKYGVCLPSGDRHRRRLINLSRNGIENKKLRCGLSLEIKGSAGAFRHIEII